MESRTGAAVTADILAGHGVSHIFMVPAVLRRTFYELEMRYPAIARVATHGEKSAVYMADGYARASRRPGVCGAQVIGAMNLAAGLREPFLAGSPVIALTGGRLPETQFRGVYQEIDDLPSFENVTKYNAVIDHPDRFADMLQHAFRVATSGLPGPVHLQVQGNEGQLDLRETTTEATVEPQFSQVPPFRIRPDDESLLPVLDLINAAERPVLVAGGGVRSSEAGAELVALAEKLSIPVVTSANGKDTIPGKHPLALGVVGTYSRECANDVVSRSDLVVFIGTRTGGMTTHFWTVPTIGTPAIQIDIEPEALARNYPLKASVLGDAKLTLARLRELADARTTKDRGGWVSEAHGLERAWSDKYRDIITSEAVPIRPERIVSELNEHLPDDAFVVVDTGNAGMWMAQFHDTIEGQGYARSAGHLGWALSAGFGAKAALPDRPVVTFTGDAGLYYHLAEIETAVRWNLASVTVVNNNNGGNQSKRGFDRAYGGEGTQKSRELWTYREADFSLIAENMGALGIRVDKPGEIGSAIDQALSSGRPAVVDIHTDIEILPPLPPL